MKTRHPRNFAAVAAALSGLVLLGLLVTGCTSMRSGFRISDKSTAFIEPGHTTRAEILATFGRPIVELKESQVIAYYWETHRGAMDNYVWNPGAGFRQEHEIYGLCDWAFCLRFDAQDRVVNQITLKARGDDSISQVVKRWAETGY